MPERALPWPRRVRRRAYYLACLASLAAARLIPLELGRALWRALGWAALRLRPRERRLAAANLALVFPELTVAERDALLAGSAQALGRNFHDSLVIEKLVGDDRRIADPLAAGPGAVLEEIRRLHARGRGLILLTGHLGCWELLGAWVALGLREAGLGDLAVVTGTVHNPAVDALLQERRARWGLRALPRQEGIAPLVAHLRRGGVAAVLLDQNIRAHSVPVDFCGRPAPTADGVARIAVKAGVPVLPIALGWDAATKRHLVRILPELRPSPAGGDPAGLLAACNAALEELLRRNPVEWVWFHDRWGTADSDLEERQR